MLKRRARSFLSSTRNPLWAALTLSALAIVAIGSPALVGAATGVGARLELGKTNSVNATTSLTATTTGSAFALKNLGTGGGLNITVKTGKSPITVSAGAGKATNLDADKLDGNDGSAYQFKLNDLQDLNGLTCPDNGRVLAHTDITCVHDPNSLEPNGTFDVAHWLGGTFGNSIDALAGNGDVDWYILPPTCEPTSCYVAVQIIGRGVKFDVYRNDELIKEDVTDIGFSDPYTGTHPTYRVRVDASSRLAYRLIWA